MHDCIVDTGGEILPRTVTINQIEDLLPWNLLAKMPELRIAA